MSSPVANSKPFRHLPNVCRQDVALDNPFTVGTMIDALWPYRDYPATAKEITGLRRRLDELEGAKPKPLKRAA